LKNFSELKLPTALEKALQVMKFEVPTPIQAQAIPTALEGRDMIGCAQTGTGKTAAFSIPMIVTLIQQSDKNALVLVPTRELASQVAQVVQDLTRFLPEMRSACLIGGVPMKPQLKALSRSPRIIVATPGRLVDHLKQRNLSLGKTGILVLDEADRMLDLGFAPQLNEILRYLPKVRQTLLFSATLPSSILSLANRYLHNPTRVQVGELHASVPKITQKTLNVSNQQKNDALLDELNAREGTVLVFARTQSRTDRVARYLESYGVSVARIHGGRSQGQRVRALDGFRQGTFRILVATDIAARGIDIDHVAHVINYDLPQVPEDYLHRIGRTGRAGRSGEALSLLTPEDRAGWKAIHRLLGGQSVEAKSAPEPSSRPRSPEPHRQRQERIQPSRPFQDRSQGGPPSRSARKNRFKKRGFKKRGQERFGAPAAVKQL
jgi:ATP-dependent RNA helicase RhlE